MFPLSVLIITKGQGRERYIKYLIESVIHQATKPKEILVIAETMPDNINELVHMCKSNGIPLKFVLHKSSRAMAINLGLRLSCTDVVLITDDDIVFENLFLSKVHKILQASQEKLKHYNCCVIIPNVIWLFKVEALERHIGVKKKVIFNLFRRIARGLETLLLHSLHRKVPVIMDTWCCIVLRKIFLEKLRIVDHRPNEPMLGEDFELSIRAWRLGMSLLRVSGLKIVHLSPHAIRRHIGLMKDPSQIKKLFRCYVYYVFKHVPYLGFVTSLILASKCLKEMVYYSVSTKSLRIMPLAIVGILEGLAYGLKATIYNLMH